ncbi:methyltransferase domain-containing protein [Ditylenchus destructor]|uniref:Methyltransferase domain-containing protein n=1 Tax=Ditylenchus destructor TaxID=166010 RepID=A0AAD4N188_9BILA|nr:methyltransferase domain-containing protein [Ditylenchus destructor]
MDNQDWNPELYLRFEVERTRPADELLSRIAHPNPQLITDLECGPGNSTELLVNAFPNAKIVGIDSSPAMLESARKRLPSCNFYEVDIASWVPNEPQDIIFANASLQWIKNHKTLFPRLFGFLAENGVLAVQMPNNDNEPAHIALQTLIGKERWAKLFVSQDLHFHLASADYYYTLLVAKGAINMDIWRTTYYDVIPSVVSFLDRIRSTRLRPYLALLSNEEQNLFLDEYSNELKKHYKMANDWKPDLYCSFEAERTRPSEELLRRVTSIVTNPKFITDLGCGPGNSTELLAKAFSNASILGTDTSEAMLEKARNRLPTCTFQQSDIGAWKPDRPQDILFANAALQWVRNHDVIFPQLFDYVAENGVLAVQMPDNHNEHTHRILRQMAKLDQWKEKLSKTNEELEVLMSPTQYYDLLSTKGAQVDIWRTTYFHVMSSVDSIVDWFRSTRLRPYLNPLNDSEQHVFLQQYSNELKQHYKPCADGRVLLPFPRLFMVARKIIR